MDIFKNTLVWPGPNHKRLDYFVNSSHIVDSRVVSIYQSNI